MLPSGRPDLPVVVCFDVEPDRRVPERRPEPWRGFEILATRLPALGERIAEVAGVVPRFTFALRMDPQIEDIYGDATWVAAHYEAELEALAGSGHGFAVHPHAARWIDGGWVSDHGDPGWVERCVATSLDAFRRAFGRACPVTRLGDRFLSRAVVRQLEDAGTIVDLSLEPLLPAVRSLAAHEATTGWLPDTTSAPTSAYRPAATDPFRADPSRTEGLVLMPLTPGVTIARHDPTAQVTGTAETLVPWMEPQRFERLLRRRLEAPGLTHLAFAVRSDTVRSAGLWAAVEANLSTVAELTRSTAWLDAADAAPRALDATGAPDDPPIPRPDPGFWALGRDDPGWREGAEPVADPAHRPVEWRTGCEPIDCAACAFAGDGQLLGHTRPDVRVGLDLVRCPSCSSITVRGALDPTSSDEALGTSNPALDGYIEYHASLESIAALVACTRTGPGDRLLDIGCGYGFALDLAAVLHGATGVGVDPSPAAIRGASELGIDVRQVSFGGSIDLGERFDAVVAAEVIEHVEDPATFLGSVRRHLADDGFLVLSTPDAGVVSADSPVAEVVAAVGTVHPFLLSADALEALLVRTGFGAIAIRSHGPTLVATARATVTASGTDVRSRGDVSGCGALDLTALARYCEGRRDSASPGSALHVGMAARAARLWLNVGDLTQAERSRDALREALLARHGWELDDPAARLGSDLPARVAPVIADAHHTAGMLDLLLHEASDRAAEHFRVAARVSAWCAESSRDPSLPALRRNALGHAAIADARHRPDHAHAAIADLVAGVAPPDHEVETLVARAFTELVARGHYAAAEQVTELLPPLPEQLEKRPAEAPDAHGRRVALDALFSLAMLDLHRGRSADAATRFSRCASLAGEAGDAHGTAMAADAHRHAALARQRIRTPDAAVEPA